MPWRSLWTQSKRDGESIVAESAVNRSAASRSKESLRQIGAHAVPIEIFAQNLDQTMAKFMKYLESGTFRSKPRRWQYFDGERVEKATCLLTAKAQRLHVRKGRGEKARN